MPHAKGLRVKPGDGEKRFDAQLEFAAKDSIQSAKP
jgi:hypothetical protein